MFHWWRKKTSPQRGPATSPPERFEASRPLYFLPVPSRPVALSRAELQVVRAMENGIAAGDLLARAGLDGAAGQEAIASLLGKAVLTWSMGRAGDVWRWRALLATDRSSAGEHAHRGAPSAGSELPELVRASTATPAPRPPAPPVLERTPTPVPAGAPVRAPATRPAAVDKHADIEALISDELEDGGGGDAGDGSGSGR